MAKTTLRVSVTATRANLIICTFHFLITLNQFSLPTGLQITTFERLIHFNEAGEQALLIAAVTVDFSSLNRNDRGDLTQRRPQGAKDSNYQYVCHITIL